MFLNAADSEHTSHTLTGNTQITATVDGGRGLTPFFLRPHFLSSVLSVLADFVESRRWNANFICWILCLEI